MTFRYSLPIDGEFAAGRITGPILELFDIGTLLLALAGLVSVLLKRTGALIAFLGTLLCLPLYIYDTAPGPFRKVFRGEYSVPLQSNFVWTRSNVTGLIALSVLSVICIREMVMARKPNDRDSEPARPAEFK